MNRSAAVAPSKPPATMAARDRLFEPVTEHERHHHAYRRGTLFDLSGHGVIRLRFARTPAPSEWTQRTANRAERRRR